MLFQQNLIVFKLNGVWQGTKNVPEGMLDIL